MKQLHVPHISRWLLIVACIAFGLGAASISLLAGPKLVWVVVATLVVCPPLLWWGHKLPNALTVLVVVVGLLPRFTSPIKTGGITPTFLDLALLGVLLVWYAQHRKKYPLRWFAGATPLLVLSGVAITAFALGTSNGSVTPLVLRRFVELLLSFGMVWLLVAVLKDAALNQRFVRASIVAGGLAGAIGMALYFMPDNTANQLLLSLKPFGYYGETSNALRFIRDDPTLLQRATGLWIDPNAYGGYLLIVASLSLPHLLQPSGQPILPRYLLLACVTCVLVGLVLSISRGAMLGLATAFMLQGLLRHRKWLVFAIVVVVGVVLSGLDFGLVNHFLEGINGQDLATQMRLGEYKDAFRLIERYPWFGVGFIDTPDGDLYIGVSSMYLLVAQYMGLVGVVSFFAVLLRVLWQGYQTRALLTQNNWQSNTWLGAYTAIVGVLVSGIFDHYFFNINFHVSVTLFWMLLALAIGSSSSTTATTKPSAI